MIFDSQEQKDFFLMCFGNMSIPGAHLDKVYAFKQACIAGQVIALQGTTAQDSKITSEREAAAQRLADASN